MSTLKKSVCTNDEESKLQNEIMELSMQMRGELVQAKDSHYEDVRSVWNGMIDRRPALIARCRGAADVIAATSFAKRNDIITSVRGGGHNVSGSSVCDGGLVIDLSLMRAVHVDRKKSIAYVQGGATGADLDFETQVFGLATPMGVVSTTGVGGLTLGGGFGWLSRAFGLAIDNLLSVDIVTADGELLTASEKEHSDLFWGVRGGRGNFGIVTTFKFRLHQIGHELLFGWNIYSCDDAPAALRNLKAFLNSVPVQESNNYIVNVDFITAPPLPDLSKEFHDTKICTILMMYVGNHKNGEQLFKPLYNFGHPIAGMLAPTPYTAIQCFGDAAASKGARNYWKSHNFTKLSDNIIDTLVDCLRKAPSDQCELFIHHVGGAVNKVSQNATAYPHRNIDFVVTIAGRWEDPTQDSQCISWVRSCYSALSAYTTGGSYVNFITEHAQDSKEAVFGPNYERLVQIKNKYDPTNFFQLNHNIRPTIHDKIK